MQRLPSAQASPVPLRSPVRPRHRVTRGDTLDPKELSRRLELCQQKERDDRRRRQARSEPRKTPAVYHHTPVFAAVDFARTATPGLQGRKDIHKLSRLALRRCQAEPDATLSPAQFVQRQEKARLKMEAAAERNQFQLTKAMEDALVLDKAREINKRQPRDFRDMLVKPVSHSGTRRNQPAGLNHVIDPDPVDLFREHNHAIHRNNKRQDWAQRDECAAKRLPNRPSHIMLRSIFGRQC